MSLDELTAWLFARTGGGVRWGLERTRELLAGAGDPHRHFRALHVGGTNGKGSVAALCAGALAAHGTRVGLYTSPHLVSFRERVRIDGAPVSEERVRAVAERMRPEIERTGATFFEATTAIAFACFAEAGVEVAVVEVGLGGRLDATNVLDPLAVAITNVSREHTEFLGDSLEGIAAEKAGILKPGVPAVTAATDPAVLAVLRERARQVGAPLLTLAEAVELERVEAEGAGTRLAIRSAAWGRRELRVGLAGAHQAVNAALAAELLALLPPDVRPAWEAVERGFARTRWPGRLQVERIRGTTWVLDVAHNPAGVAALADALPSLELPRPLVLLAGVLADKDWRAMLEPLATRADAVVLATPPTAPPDRRWDAPAAAAWLAERVGVPVRPIDDFQGALDRAATLAPHGTVLVTGSFHTVGDAMAMLGIGTE